MSGNLCAAQFPGCPATRTLLRRAWPRRLDPTHILALTLTEELLSPLEGSYLAEPLSELRARLQATLTPAARGYAAELRRTAVATLFAPGHYAEKSKQLATIHEAIEKQQVLIVQHQKPGHQPTERKVAPYATWYASGKLYLVGHCHTAGATRRFAVARIVSARISDETFEPDPSFDINAFVEGGCLEHAFDMIDESTSFREDAPTAAIQIGGVSAGREEVECAETHLTSDVRRLCDDARRACSSRLRPLASLEPPPARKMSLFGHARACRRAPTGARMIFSPS